MIYEYQHREMFNRMGCGPVIAVIVILVLLCSCATKQSTESTTDYRYINLITERMDSMLHVSRTWQQQLYERQTALVDSFKQREVRDTSRTIFLGAKGDTIREKVIIKETVEREHSTDKITQERYEEILRQTDSIFSANKTLSAKVDSLLHLHHKATVVKKEAPWYERTLDSVGRIVIFIMAGILIGIMIRKRIFR